MYGKNQLIHVQDADMQNGYMVFMKEIQKVVMMHYIINHVNVQYLQQIKNIHMENQKHAHIQA